MSEATEAPVTQTMRLFIEELAAAGSWREACIAADVNDRTPRRWLQNHAGFKALYSEVFGDTDKDSYKKQAQILQSKALRVYDESMDAAQTVEIKVQCPDCGCRFEYEYVVPNSGTRLKAADSISKINAMLKDTKEHTGVIGHVDFTQLLNSGALMSAFLAHRAGVSIAPALLTRLKEIGVVDTEGKVLALPSGEGRAVDGEYREVP